MSDELLVPDRRVVSIGEAREEREAAKSGKPRSIGKGGDFITRDDVADKYVPKADMVRLVSKVNDGISNAALAVGQKIYDQMSGEFDERLQAHANVIEQLVKAELAKRTWRGRWKSVRARVRDYGVELGLVSPLPVANLRIVDASEALDPNVQTRAEEDADDEDDASESLAARGLPHPAAAIVEAFLEANEMPQPDRHDDIVTNITAQ